MSKSLSSQIIKPASEQKLLHSAFEQFIIRHKLAILVIICVIAAARIFLFSAAYPFFTNVDEDSHFDLVCKYAQGHIPSGIENFSNQGHNFFVTYRSPEFLTTPSQFPDNSYPPPIWSVLSQDQLESFRQLSKSAHQSVNYESTQPPVYYSLAGRWFKLGMIMGLDGGQLLYWLRFMNVLIYILLVLAAYVFVKRLYPQNVFLQFGVPSVLAVFPQDVFYSINNDIPSALLFTLALYCLLDIYLSKRTSYIVAACAGLMVAATMLTKYSNGAIMAALAVVVIRKGWDLWSGRKAKNSKKDAVKYSEPNSDHPIRPIATLAVLLLTAALPVALWMLRDYLLMHDWTGSGAKTSYLGWELKPFTQMWHHPIFTLAGFGYFLAENVRTLWRGEIYWTNSRLSSAGSDLFYVATTGVFMVAGLVSVFKLKQKEASAHIADIFGLVVITISLGLLFIVSIAYDFGSCRYPSQAEPFLISGRLLLGALVPFLVLYLHGLDYLLSLFRLSRFRYLALLLLIIAIGLMDTSISLCVFNSQYNWFHML